MFANRFLSVLACGLVMSAGCGLLPGDGGSGLTKDDVTADTHSLFPVASTSKHSSTTCNDCHGTFDTFGQFACTDCHAHELADTTSRHSDVADFTYDSASCYRCHPEGSATSIDHQPIFQIGATSKHAVSHCNDCHIDPASRSNVSCTGSSCHPQPTSDTGHVAVQPGSGGYVWATPDCLSCHPVPSVFRVSSHNDCVSHQGARCRTCHAVNTLAGKPFAATDFTQHSCTGSGCHSGDQGTSCSAINHEPIFKIAATSKHASAQCTDCHIDPATRTTVSCTGSSCHPSSATGSKHSMVLSGTGGYVWVTADCLSCHPVPSVFRVVSHNNCKTHRQSRCRTCHKALLAGKPFPATDFSQHSCTGSGCHGSNQGTSCD